MATAEDCKPALERQRHARQFAEKMTRYHAYLLSLEWKQKRAKIIKRDKSCVLCDSKRRLEVHHRTYRNLYDENEWELVTLCHECHSRYERGKRWRKMWRAFGEIWRGVLDLLLWMLGK